MDRSRCSLWCSPACFCFRSVYCLPKDMSFWLPCRPPCLPLFLPGNIVLHRHPSRSPRARPVTPFQCRLRDCTYSAPLWVNVRYTRGRQIVNKTNINIGRIPVMLLRYAPALGFVLQLTTAVRVVGGFRTRARQSC